MGEVIRVLIADDVDDYRMLLRMQLEADPRFEVIGEATNGREAVTMATSHAPDVVVLDIAMPVMDGLAAAREIRTAMPDTRIVVVSGFGRDVGEARAIARGADLYMEKGGPVRQLPEALADLVLGRTTARNEDPD